MASKSNARSTFQDGFPVRWISTGICFLSFVFLFVLRVNINITIVSMVNYTAIPHANVTASDECGAFPNETDPDGDEDEDGEFAWDESTQALILGSFFWGYIFMQIPGGRMAEIFGTKIMLGISQVVAGLVTMSLPLFAELGAGGVIAARVLLGISQGVAFPSLQAWMARWAPPQERSGLISFVYAGTQIGTVIGLPLAGVIVESLGWRNVFYIEGAGVLLFTLVWFTCLYDTPEKHPRISESEKTYVMECIREHGVHSKALSVPISSILTSPRFWAILVSNFGNNWGFYMLLTELPIYLKNILHESNMSNSLHSALPYLMMWLFSLITGFISNVLLSKKVCSTTTVRKIFNSIAQFGPASCLIGVSYVGCNPPLAFGLLTLAVCLQGACYSGYLSNPIDIAPNFAGTILGISGSISTIPSWVAPLTVGILTNGNQTIERWRIAFLIAAGVMAFDGTFFLIFSSGEVQPWNEPVDKKDDKKPEPTFIWNYLPRIKAKNTLSGQVNPAFTDEPVVLPRLAY